MSSDKKIKKISSDINNNNTDMELKYVPIMVELTRVKDDKSIFDFDANTKFSTNIDYPRQEYGFHHFIHANKNKLEILKEFEGKKKVYLVMNMFEKNIDNHEEDIASKSIEYFDLKNKPVNLNDKFYNLWEILMIFNLIDLKNNNFSSTHISDDGSFIQSTMFYRDMFCKKGLSKNDKFYYVINVDNKTEVNNKFIEYYNKESPKRIILQKKESEKSDLITSDGNFEYIHANIREQGMFRSIVFQINIVIKSQKKGGSFVCKFFETFTRTSLKFICILYELYDKVYFVKPLTGGQYDSEKYMVCTGFKYDDKDKKYKSIEKKINELVESLQKNQKEKIVDIFPSYIIPKHLIDTMIHINRSVSNQQLKSINEIVRFIKRNIYSGDEYHDKRDEQIYGSKYWINLFFPSDIEKNKKLYENMTTIMLNNTHNELVDLTDSLVFVQMQN